MISTEGFRKSSYSFTSNCLEALWRKSSYSVHGDCLEAAFRKSSRCNGGTCAEAALRSGTVLVRDSKLGKESPVLEFTPAAWQAFLARVTCRS